MEIMDTAPIACEAVDEMLVENIKNTFWKLACVRRSR
jgi:hypothetical protein